MSFLERINFILRRSSALISGKSASVMQTLFFASARRTNLSMSSDFNDAKNVAIFSCFASSLIVEITCCLSSRALSVRSDARSLYSVSLPTCGK